MTDEYLFPARNVAEYAYCPRLFYLMEVEGIHLPSVDTEKGQAVHKRVNRPSAQKQEKENESETDSPQTVRKLTLSDEKLGLTATLDLAEISGNKAVPVEYRKGRPYQKPILETMEEEGDPGETALTYPEPWPTDRIQLTLQAILLEKGGYRVEQGILFYAAEKLRLTVPMDKKAKAEALSILEKAKTCARGSRPDPLVNDPRCVGCSLQPLCLPDEINLIREPETQVSRKIWPPREDGIQAVIQKRGTRIGIRGLSLNVLDQEKTRLKEIPLPTLESLALLGSVQISTQALHTLADRGIPVAFMSPAGRLVAMVDPLDSVSAHVRKAQVKRFDLASVCLQLSRTLVTAKILNQRTLLLRNHENLPDRVAREMKEQAEAAAQAQTLEAIRGFEGRAAAIYFEYFSGMLKSPFGKEFDANGRSRRPPPDPVNACLSLGYSQLTHECTAALRLARLEPSIGAFHVSRPGRPALSLDLMEPFRPLIADSIALSTFNRGELVEGHFFRSAAGCLLTDAGRRSFFNAYARRMDTFITHPVFKYRLTYRRMIQLHARMIAAWVVGDIPSLAFITTR